MPLDPVVKERLERWRDKLVDLTRSNRLLAWRPRKTSVVEVVEEDPAEVVGLLEAGKRLAFDAVEGEGAAGEGPRSRAGDRRLQTSLDEETLGRVLLRLYRESRASARDQGFNTLHLAVGALAFTTPGDPEPWRAPLWLVPVQLVRRGARSALELEAYDEDARVNPALLLKLEKDLGIAALPPEGGEGFEQVREAFRALAAGRPGWEVEDAMGLGLFSFAKLALYRDLLEQEEEVGAHPLVQALARGGAGPGAPEAPLPGPADVEARSDPAGTYQILDADSSQQAAVLAANEGRSFVLQGPPGTGKSQTIANVIAEALAAGRTVLFVSEKMAALEVVKKRLDDAGLGDSCLELHSRKASKKEVVASLERAWRRHGREEEPPPIPFAELRELTDALRGYVEALHAPRGTSRYSAFEVFGHAVELDAVPECPAELPNVLDLERDRLLAVQRLLEDAKAARVRVEPVARHPWRASALDALGVGTLDEVRRGANRLGAALDDAGQAAAGLAARLGLPEPGTAGASEALVPLARHLLATPRPPAAWLARAWRGTSPRALGALEVAEARRALEAALRSRYAEGVLDLDPAPLVERAAAKGLFGWWRRRGVRRRLAAHLAPGARVDLAADVQALATRRRLDAEVEEGRGILEEAFGDLWAGRRSDVQDLLAKARWVAGLHAVRPAGSDVSPAVLALAAGEGLPDLERAATRLADALRHLAEQKARMLELARLDEAEAFPGRWADAPLHDLRDVVSAWAEGTDRLPPWCAWRAARGRAEAEGLRRYLDAFDAVGLPSSRLVDAWFRAFWRAFADLLLVTVPPLEGFDGTLHQARVERWRRLDRQQAAAARSRARARLLAALPSPTVGGIADSEVGILKRELQKQRGHLATRLLFERVPNLLRALKPCLMMSPLSVATYLPPGPSFDLVVFDEASQIVTEDAVGAISRGRQVIVAGDTKQLPPTSFFERALATEDEDAPEEGTTDLQSVLDEAEAGALPEIPLRWHYRSRDESLIAFSNEHFYENGLVTFPHAARDADDLGMSFVHVEDGVYHPGRGLHGGTNPREAEVVAAKVLEILDARPDDSVGVVTFSTAQRDAVLDALEVLRRADDRHEARFADDADEVVFVKNLEAVQGDERDVILFSVGYGPDAQGRFAMRFGPLNQEGGDRRLNVAVTRARKQVIVHASFLPDVLDVERAPGRGPRLLKAYLEAARRGLALAPPTGEGAQVPRLVGALARALRERGLGVETGVGRSAFRVDVAVRHPDHPERFLLAVLTDGPAYARAATTRDRERTREEALMRLGWHVHRVFAPDWIRSPATVLAQVLDAVDRARSAPGAPEVPAVEPVDASAEEPPATPDEPIEEAPLPGLLEYRPANLKPRGPAAEFHVVPIARVAAALDEVVRAEGPIHVDLALRRVATAWGVARAGSRVTERVEEATRRLVAEGKALKRGDFLHDPAAGPVVARRPAGGVLRDVEHVPPEEIADVLRRLVDAHLSVPRESLVKEAARVLGHARVRERTAAAIDAILGGLVESGALRQADDRLTLGVPATGAEQRPA
jgi:hypothetical protein